MVYHRNVFVAALSLGLLTAACSPPAQQPDSATITHPRIAGPLEGRPSLQDLFELDTVDDAAIDPSGSRVAYVKRMNSLDAPSRELRVWTQDADQRVIGSEDGFTGGARWMPDGNRLVFLTRSAQGAVLKFLDPNSPASPATERPVGLDRVLGYEVSPDGRMLALVSEEASPDRRGREQELLGPFEEEDVPAPLTHLWLLDLTDDAAKPRQVTQGDFSVHGIAWSPTSREIAVVVGPADERNNWWTRDISLLDVQSGTLTPWVAQKGVDDSPVWSPDGSRLAFFTTLDQELTNAAGKLAVVDKPGFDGSAPLPAVEVVTGSFQTEPFPVAWTADGIVFSSTVGTGSGLFVIDADGTIRGRGPSGLVLMGVGRAAPGATVLAIIAAPADGMAEVYRVPVAGGDATRITHLGEQVADWPLVTTETIRWKAADGVEIEGVLHRLAGLGPAEPRPLVVVVHGGPRAASQETIADRLGQSVYPVMHWLWKGALVLEPNYRGSAGYGTAFRRLHRAGVGSGDAGDVLAGIHSLVAQGLVDPKRVGVAGWSYGGFISAWLSSTSQEIAAASVGAGITDWGTHYGWESANFTTRDFTFGGPPWEQPDAYVRASPLTYIAAARTPTLVQHVEDDPIVPMAGARRFYRALLEQGVATRMFVYPGRTHGIGEPRQRLGAAWHNWQWFARYLWDETAEIPVGGR